MGIRNCADIGENLQKIVTRLLANDDLVKLLYYSDKDPYSKPALTEEQKQKEVFEKLIKIVPRVGPKEDAKSLLVIRVVGGRTNMENSGSERPLWWRAATIKIPCPRWWTP